MEGMMNVGLSASNDIALWWVINVVLHCTRYVHQSSVGEKSWELVSMGDVVNTFNTTSFLGSD